MNTRVPLRFFVVTFGWSGAIWSPLVVAGLGVVATDADLVARLATPAAMLGAFGPAIGACVAIGTSEGRAALLRFRAHFGSARLGWRGWAAVFAVLGAVGVVAFLLLVVGAVSLLQVTRARGVGSGTRRTRGVLRHPRRPSAARRG